MNVHDEFIVLANELHTIQGAWVWNNPISDDCINWLKTDTDRKWCISITVFITYPFYNLTISWIIQTKYKSLPPRI